MKTHEIATFVLALSRSLTGHYDAQLADLNLTLPQAMLLRQLGEPLAMNQAAEKLHCKPSNVTGIVDRLEARGLIERRPGTADRRVKRLTLTAEGRRLKRQVDAILSDSPGLSSLSAGDQTVLRDLLRRSIGG